ncbi:hypothetical protein ACJW30_01G041200 [Castanea mollissima]
MCPPAVPSDIESNLTAEIIKCLCKINKGDLDLPSNLLTNVDFLRCDPEHLPPDMWFLINSEVDGVNEHGKWSIKGEAYKIVLDSTTTCSRTTFEFYKGQGPHKRRTSWVMHEYRILQRGQFEGSNMKETNSLCRVLRDGKQSQNHEKQLKLGSTNTASENHIHTTHSVVPNADNSIGQSSTSQPRVCQPQLPGLHIWASEDDDIVMLGLEHQHQNLHEIDHPPEGDFLEMMDLLDEPASPSSSESSCVTMSSDECFDSLALLQELEAENNQNDAGCKFNVSAPVKPNEVKVFPASTGSLDRDREKMLTPSAILKTDSSTPESAVRCQVNRIQRPNFGNEGPSSNSQNVTPPFSGHNRLAADKEKMAHVGKKKKCWKYLLCFMSF